MKQIRINVNGADHMVDPNQTVLAACRSVGVEIPTLCWYPAAKVFGGCRLCVVEIEPFPGLRIACGTDLVEHMIIRTHTPKVLAVRKQVVELLLAAGDHNCLICEKNAACALQRLAYEFGIERPRFDRLAEIPAPDDSNPFIIRDFSKCVMCGRCIQACNEVQVNGAIAFGRRGLETKIVTTNDRPLLHPESDCVFCGECVQACPVGALVEKKSKGKGRIYEMKLVRTTCPYCGVGCQQWLHVNKGKIVKVTGVSGAEPNQGRLCVKGRFGYDFIYSSERLTTPLIKEDGKFREASWDEALDLVAAKFKDAIAKHGPDAVAGVSCSRSINEDSYQMQKLFRSVFKTNNIDNCART